MALNSEFKSFVFLSINENTVIDCLQKMKLDLVEVAKRQSAWLRQLLVAVVDVVVELGSQQYRSDYQPSLKINKIANLPMNGQWVDQNRFSSESRVLTQTLN